MTNIAVFGGLLLLLLPGLYLVGRLAVVAPAAADRAIYNPLEAIRASWVLSEKRGWSIFLFVLMVASAVAVVSLIASVVAAALTGDGQEIGRASCRERVCQYVSFSGVAGSLKKKKQTI